MKTILVPVDGSEFSQRALLQAKELANCLGSKIILLNVLSVLSTFNYYPNRFAMRRPPSMGGTSGKSKKNSEELMEESKKLLAIWKWKPS